MLLGFGWCHLRSSREAIREARLSDIDRIDAEIDAADQKLWNEFRTWMCLQTVLSSGNCVSR